MDFISFGESVDKLITVDVPCRGVIHNLYSEAKKIHSRPLTLEGAEALRRRTSPGDRVLITTGFLIPPTMAPETDGPLGALILSRALNASLGLRTIIMGEDEVLSLITKLAKAIGMETSFAKVSRSGEDVVRLSSFPKDEESAFRRFAETLKELEPSALIAIEKAGRNGKGVYHNMRGMDVSSRTAKVDHLFIEAERRGILTIGIGDGGNEIGMGSIAEAVRRHVPFGAVCNCPCRGGIAAATGVDILVVATVSNWGAYGIAANLLALTGRGQMMHEGEVERLLLSKAYEAGAVDGATRRNAPTADGLSSETHAQIVEILKTMLTKGTET